MQRISQLFLTGVCGLVLAACASPSGTSTADGTDKGGRQLFESSGTQSSSTSANQAVVTLPAYHWNVQQVSGADQAWFTQGKASLREPLQLTFYAENVTVSGLCNRMTGGYTVQGDRMAIKQLMSTKRACADQRLMQLENAVGAALSGAQQWRILGTSEAPQLQLQFANGSQWLLQGTPTDETRYGSAAERLFLEVAPNTRPCNAGAAAQQCLEVREVHFNESGIRTGSGPWELFYQQIQGYQHEAGMRNVLRVNRYTRKDVPADASRYVYVLDMRVSSEIAR